MFRGLLSKIQQNDIKALARCISMVENESAGYKEFLQQLPSSATKVIGITGPPGAGKSTLTDILIELFINENKKVAVVCVDPSSPFNLGALLGDRIRMSRWYNKENVFIRSIASRGSLGGLSSKIIEITDVIKAALFDVIIVETVGVGQSEVEIAGLADTTVVVLVPEAGDEIQTMKAGLMEVADIFAINKSDRPGADIFARNLRLMLAPAFSKTEKEIPVISMVANKNEGVADLYKAIQQQLRSTPDKERQTLLLTEKAWQLIQNERMKHIDKNKLKESIRHNIEKADFNLYRWVHKILYTN